MVQPGSRTVDGQLAVADDLLDLAVGLEVLQRLAGERAVDLETIDEGGDGDQAVRLDILVELVGDVLVEDDSVLGLVLDCDVSAQFLQSRCARCGAAGRLCARYCRRGCASRRRILVLATVTYPCPWTTSSSASCLRLLRVPFCRMCE